MNFQPDEGPGVRSRLNQALGDALRGRDQPAISALRSALAAIANAEAVDAGERPAAAAGSPHFAGAAAGPGATEAARKELTETAVQDIVRAEIADRQTAIGQYRQGGHAERADRLQAETPSWKPSSRPAADPVALNARGSDPAPTTVVATRKAGPHVQQRSRTKHGHMAG